MSLGKTKQAFIKGTHAMQGYAAYKQTQNLPTTRIDLILASYRKALDQLTQARAFLEQQRRNDALPYLTRTQLIIIGMASGLPAYKDESALNFLRLYEFVAHQLTLGTVASLDAASSVLRTLLTGFEKVRDQAAALESQGKIPPLGSDHLVSFTA
jgi:flagellin-specific chaperone FliS